MIAVKYKVPLTFAAVVIAVVAYGALTMHGRSISERVGDAVKDADDAAKDTANP